MSGAAIAWIALAVVLFLFILWTSIEISLLKERIAYLKSSLEWYEQRQRTDHFDMHRAFDVLGLQRVPSQPSTWKKTA
jgi:hypothetical protein